MRTIAVTEDRNNPMATSRRRSALEEAWMDDAVLMSFLTVLGLVAGMPGSAARRRPCRARAGRGGCLGRVTHSIHTRRSEIRAAGTRGDLRRDEEDAQHPFARTHSP